MSNNNRHDKQPNSSENKQTLNQNKTDILDSGKNEVTTHVEESLPENMGKTVKNPDTEKRVDEKERVSDVKNKNPKELNILSTYKLKETVKTTVNNMDIPEFAYRNSYKISKILNDRVLIKAGQYVLAVKPDDIVEL